MDSKPLIQTPPPLAKSVFALLAQNSSLPSTGWTWTALAGDGSDRIFFRGRHAGHKGIVAIGPAPGRLDEAQAAHAIGRHLFARTVPVPEIFGQDQASGIMLCEDLGDEQLYDRVHSPSWSWSDDCARQLYGQAVTSLALLQTAGALHFDPAWCWDTPRYDLRLMVDRESGYFFDACCRNFLGMDIPPQAAREAMDLARRAAALPADFLLHRDYQSRNLLLHDGRVRIIDFQGARLGPLGYDLASLLLDPYVRMPVALQEEMQHLYLAALGPLLPKTTNDALTASFADGYHLLALQRSMQVLGAFAFLGAVKKKTFFFRFLPQAADTLASRLENTRATDYPVLRRLARHCQEKIHSLFP